MEVLVAIDQVDDQLHLSLGWSGWNVKRVDPASYRLAVERLRSAVVAALVDPERRECLELVDRLDALGADARVIPILRGVLIDRPKAYDVLDELRQAVPKGILARRAREL